MNSNIRNCFDKINPVKRLSENLRSRTPSRRIFHPILNDISQTKLDKSTNNEDYTDQFLNTSKTDIGNRTQIIEYRNRNSNTNLNKFSTTSIKSSIISYTKSSTDYLEKDNLNKLRYANKVICKENTKIKDENRNLEKQIDNFDKNKNIKNFSQKRKNLMSIIYTNNVLVYKILNILKDIHVLNKNINISDKKYMQMKIPHLSYKKNILNNEKEDLKLLSTELKSYEKNLNILYQSVIKKNEDNRDLIFSLKNVIKELKFKLNYINNYSQAKNILQSLMNQKKQMFIFNNNIKKKLKSNIKINLKPQIQQKNQLQKYNVNLKKQIQFNENEIVKLKQNLNQKKIIQAKINQKLNIYKNFNNNLDQKIKVIMDKNFQINNQINYMSQNYSKEIKNKEKIITYLQLQYMQTKKDELTSMENKVYSLLNNQ